MFFSIPGEMSVSRPRRRVRTDDLVSIKWPRNALRRRNFPDPVILMRFLAPLSVFILGISILLLRLSGRGAYLGRLGYFVCCNLCLYRFSLGLGLLIGAQ